MRKDSASYSTDQKQRWCSSSSVPLHVLDSEQVLVRKQVTVDTREHHAGKSIVLECSACHCLAAALERDEGQGK